jgi:hypothetical protein
MNNIKKDSEPVVHASVLRKQVRKEDNLDPAARAGLAKNNFYQTDRWQVGRDQSKTYIVPKNTIPKPMENLFVKTGDKSPVTEKIRYDRTKFQLDEMTDIEGGRVNIALLNSKDAVADVTFENKSFVVNMFELPKTGVFSCSKEELAKAIHAAKWILEIYVMPQFERDLESSSDGESEKKEGVA